MSMYSLEDGRKQLKTYNRKSNSYPKVCLNYRSPNEVWEQYAGVL
jgi:IS30 family transposase